MMQSFYHAIYLGIVGCSVDVFCFVLFLFFCASSGLESLWNRSDSNC